MNHSDAIIGIDFLCQNGIIIDFGSVTLFSDRDRTKVICEHDITPIIKNNNKQKKRKQRKDPFSDKNSMIHTSTPTITTRSSSTIPVSNFYDCLPIENDDMQYGSDVATEKHVKQNFEDDIVSEIARNKNKIIFGCKNRKFFCNANKENKKTKNETKTRTNNEIESKNISKHVLPVPNPQSVQPETLVKKKWVQFSASAQDHVSTNAAKENTYASCTSVLNTLLRANAGHVFSSDLLSKGRLCFSDILNMLKQYCTPSRELCNINRSNLHICLESLLIHLKCLSHSVKIGTNYDAVIKSLNVYNDVLYEVKKFLIRDCVHHRTDLNKFCISLGKITLNFNDLFKAGFNLNDILQYISILKKEITLFAKAYKNIEPNADEILNEKDYNNEIYKNILTVHSLKEYIILPARAESIISILVDTNEEQLCLAREIQENVYVGNCIISPRNNVAVISVLNSSEKDIEIDCINLELTPFSNYNILNFESNEENERVKKLFDKIDFNGLNRKEEEALKEILIEYNKIFYLDGDTLSHTSAITHKIDLIPGTKPINSKPYRLPMSQRQEINKQVGKMLDEGIISPTNSAWNSPLILVPKKSNTDEKKYRLVIDYRKLNDVSVGDKFPMTDINDILDNLGKASYFSTLDLASGYHQVLVDPKDRHLTAFSTGCSDAHNNNALGNQYEFNRLPFGLKNAPATFNRLMRAVMTGLQGICCMIFLDDVIIFGYDLEDHMSRIRTVFDRFMNNNLKMQPEKCTFLRKEVGYLGHLITSEGIKPDPKKTIAIKNFPTPKTQKQIKSFLGLVGFYRRFIFNFADKAKPLTNLLKKDANFIWDQTCAQAFETLKQAIMSEPILQHPNFKEKFILTTDASGVAISGVLSQGEIGKDLPIAFASRTLNDAEKRYSTTEREMLAIYWSIKQFRTYLFATQFVVITDHKPLQWVFKVKDIYSRLFRMRLYLSEYDFVVIYKPGRENHVADALSRYVPEDDHSTEHVNPDLSILNKPILHTNLHIDEANCDVVTRGMKNKQKEEQNIIEPVSPYSNFIPSSDARLANKTFQNCISYINDCNAFNCTLAELNISQKKENDHKFLLLSSAAFSNISKSLTLIKKHVHFSMQSNIYTFYLKILDEVNYEIFFDALLEMMNYMKENDIRSIHCIKTNKYFDNLNYIKAKQILRYIFHDTNIKIKIYINEIIHLTNESDILNLIKETHNSVIGGHTGMKRTMSKLKEMYYWKSMKKDIANYIASCDLCQRNKINRRTRMPMVITTTARKTGERWALDIVGPLPRTIDDYEYILTCQDDLSRYIVAVPLKNQETETIARAFTDHIILKFGCPLSILTDNGANFIAQLMKRVCKLLHIKAIQTTPYHPESNGALERSHRALKEYLRSYVNKNLNDWNNYIQFAVFSYNTTPHSSTKFTPHELIFGQKAEIPSALVKKPDTIYNYDDFVSEFKYKMQSSHELARENLLNSKQISKRQFDKSTNPISFQVGDLVLIENHTNKKLGSRFDGPYLVTEIISDTNTRLKIKNKEKVVHNNRLKLYHN